MKRNSLFLALTALMVFSFGLAHGDQSITLSSMTGLYGVDSVVMNQPVRWTFKLTNTDGNWIKGFTNGFEVYTTNGLADIPTAYRTAITYDSLPIPGGWDAAFEAPKLVMNPFSVNGFGADTVGFGASKMYATGFVSPTTLDVWWVETTPNTDEDTLCIDSAFYPPGGEWLWATDAVPPSQYPSWDGPHCFHVYYLPNPFPTFDSCAGTIYFDHCIDAQYVTTVTNVDGNGLPEGVTFALLPGLPAGDGITQSGNQVTWDYTPSLADVTDGPYTISIEVSDPSGGKDTCTFNVVFTNVAPTFISGCGETVLLTFGNTATHTVTAEDCTGDIVHYLIDSVTPPLAGSVNIHPDNGLITFTSVAPDDGNKLFTVTIGATDGVDTNTNCEVYFDVVSIAPHMEVWIEKEEGNPGDGVIQGQHTYVDVTFKQVNNNTLIGAFDILIAYDRSALNFQRVVKGPLFANYPGDDCDWEYITWRTWFHPSYDPHFFWGGIVRVIGMAEINDGANHPDWVCTEGYMDEVVLFELDFLVTDNRQYECQFVPMYFFWTDCGDNVISDKTGDSLFIEDRVWAWDTAYGGRLDEPVDPEDSTFPSIFGVMDATCLVGQKEDPIPYIYFYNGGVKIICGVDIDARGDINLNGIANEIADAVVFTNYFIYGFNAFHVNVDGQTAATDVNADGLVLTVGDLVYLTRVIIGDAMPYPKLAPVEANYVVDKGVISVDAEMGAALVVVEGDVTPTLLADNMDIKYAYNAEENVTRVLVYSLEGNGFSGEFLNANGNVVSLELGSYEGAVVKMTEIPANFALNQNYPNPFNPTTTISFNLPVSSEYTLTVYNVTGQMVTQFAGEAEAGVVSIEWDASTNASGIYFYKLNAGDFSATKKMVLLK